MYYSYTAEYDAAFFVTLLIVFLFAYVVGSALQALLFRKAGIPMWKAFVPFYSTYLEHCLAFETEKWPFLLLLFIPYVGTAYAFYWLYKLAKSFGASTGMAVVTMVFPVVGYLVLGLGNYTYKGPQEHFAK